MKRIIALFLSVFMVLSLSACREEERTRDITVLFTNDVHCAVDENLGYASLAQVKKELLEAGCEVILADMGDAIQGGPIGTISKGEYIVDIMNYVGYDVAVPGNHEFDYGSQRLMELAEKAEYTYVATNFKHTETGKSVFEPYKIIEKDGVKLAFVGVATPKTITSSAPVYFQNEEGEYIYSFDQDETGEKLYKSVQESVDKARKAGADYVIALAHLGIEAGCAPWMSTELIYNTTGIDVLLDGHSHSTFVCERVKNKDGKEVLMSQTGTRLSAIGKLTIDKEGNITIEHITEVSGVDGDTLSYIEGIKNEFNTELQTVVAASDVTLTVNDPETGERIVRNCETNLGDLCADAYRSIAESDIAFVNGGGIRTDIEKGEITYEEILNVHPFGNALCVVEATGEEILDALEMGAMDYPNENGGFLHVSGLTYEIDSEVKSTVALDEEGLFKAVEGERRVKNVKINGEDLIENKIYTLASHDYMLKNGGDGFGMFMDNTLLQDSIMLDNQVLITYITEHLGGVIGEEYTDPFGQGRIVIK